MHQNGQNDILLLLLGCEQCILSSNILYYLVLPPTIVVNDHRPWSSWPPPQEQATLGQPPACTGTLFHPSDQEFGAFNLKKNREYSRIGVESHHFN